MNLQVVIDADAIDAVGLRRQPGLWRRVYARTVDDVIDLDRHHAHFEHIGGLAAGVGRLQRSYFYERRLGIISGWAITRELIEFVLHYGVTRELYPLSVSFRDTDFASISGR